MVNGVPREVPRPKPEGPQAPGVLAEGLASRYEKKESLFYTVMLTLQDCNQAGCCPIELKVHWNSHVRY